MIKTKLISNSDCVEFEKNLNDFIKDKKVVDIKYKPMWIPTSMHGATITSTTIFDRVLVIYEEDENDK